MITPILILISLGCLAWFVYELGVAWKLVRRGIRRNAVVSKREWVSRGRTRNLRVSVSFETESGRRELPIGFLSWYGFRKLQVGNPVRIIHHPESSFAVPAGCGGLLARPLIAGSLALAVSIVAAAFSLSRSF